MNASLPTLISVEEAWTHIQTGVTLMPEVSCPLEEAHGRVLREPIHADRDLPPFDRATLDGVAISSEAWRAGVREFAVEGEQPAGAPPGSIAHPLGCLEIMTGAPLPRGADCVVRIEDVTIRNGRALIGGNAQAATMDGVHPRGSDHAKGDLLLSAGRRLRAAQIAIAASVNAAQLTVSRQPSVAIVATGDELVSPGSPAAAHQVRLSNTYALRAALASSGYPDVSSFHLTDNYDILYCNLAEILKERDVLVLTGGVSMGKRDFVPAVLEALGVRPVFHKVKQRPGKPLWFGLAPAGKPVFGLPGNPVSALVGFYRYVLPALEHMIGAEAGPREVARLDADVRFEPDLTLFMPAAAWFDDDGTMWASPRPVNTSGDVAGLAEVDGVVELERTRNVFPKGMAAVFHRFTG